MNDSNSPGDIRDQVTGKPIGSMVEFRSSGIHGLGAFAIAPIPEETRIIQYVGQIIDKKEAALRCEKNNEYIFNLDAEKDLDGNVGWNPAKFINHSCDPNCEARQEGDEIFIFSLRDIKVGEELSFNYNYDIEDFREHPCKCGAKNCVGYMVAEEFFDQVRRITDTTEG